MNRKKRFKCFAVLAIFSLLIHPNGSFQNALFAQTPQGFNYQAVARDTDGTPLAQTALTVRIGILSGSASGPLVWGEEHAVVAKTYPCVPCRKKGCEDSEVSRCLEELSLEETRDRILEHMAFLGL